MSLLLNLINYSSSLQNDYKLSLPNDEVKDSRSRSLYHQTEQQQNQRSKLSSKSLSKILGQKPQPAIDPKTRILHRISHLLSIKCKKHYYALFVTLQTLKKKNLYLTLQGEFDKMQNKIQKVSPFFQNQRKQEQRNILKKQVSQAQKDKILTRFAQKIEEIQKLIIIKQFQKYTKYEVFITIKNNYLYKDRVDLITSKLQKYLSKFHELKFFRNLRKISQYAFKIQILMSLIDNLHKKYHKVNSKHFIQIKKEIFQKINQFNSKQQQAHQQKSHIQTIIQTQKNKQLSLSEKYQKQHPKINCNVKQQTKQITNKILQQQSVQKLTNNSFENKILVNQNIPQVKIIIQSDQFLPCSIKQSMQSLQNKILNSEKRKFQRNQITILKSYQPKTSINDQPMIISSNIQLDKLSNFCKKIPKNYYTENNKDVDQQSNYIFSDPNPRNSFSSRFKQSRVVPYSSNKFNRTNQKFNQYDINSSDQKPSDFSISQISGISFLKNQKSTNTLINDKLLNFSSIGVQAVNLKNSLVQQRESLKESDKNFIKKQPQNDEIYQRQVPLNSKQFLRTTLDSKGKSKANEYQSNNERKSSKSNVNQLFIKNKNPYIQQRPSMKYKQINWTRPSSSSGRQKKQTQIQLSDNFTKVNMSIVSNQNIYPTRDTSGYYTQDSKNGINMNVNFNKKEVIEKVQKQKSFIKLLSKKQNNLFIKN